MRHVIEDTNPSESAESVVFIQVALATASEGHQRVMLTRLRRPPQSDYHSTIERFTARQLNVRTSADIDADKYVMLVVLFWQRNFYYEDTHRKVVHKLPIYLRSLLAIDSFLERRIRHCLISDVRHFRKWPYNRYQQRY